MWAYVTQDADVGSIGGVTAATVDKSYGDFIQEALAGKFATAGTILLQHESDNFTVSKAMQFHPRLKQAIQVCFLYGISWRSRQSLNVVVLMII